MPHPVDLEPTLTIPQLAQRWQCSPDSVRRMIARGELKAVRIGRLIRIRPADVARAERPVTNLERNLAAAGGGVHA